MKSTSMMADIFKREGVDHLFCFPVNPLIDAAAARNPIGTLTIVFINSCLGGYEKFIPVATKLYKTRFLWGNYSQVTEGLGA